MEGGCAEDLDGHGEHVAVRDDESVAGRGCFDEDVLEGSGAAVGTKGGSVLMGAQGRIRALLLLLFQLGHLSRCEVRRQTRGCMEQAARRRYLKGR
jgi:hypothetical protein